MKFLKLFMLFCCFFAISIARAQSISNEGMEFWSVFPPHDKSSGQGATEATMYIFVTSRYTSEVTVSCGSYSEKKAIPANTAISFEVPRSVSYTGFTNSNSVTINKGIHIVVTEGKPKVSVYGHMFASARSAASLILPIEALGQQYFSFNYTQDSATGETSKNYLILQAVEANTDLILTDLNGAVTKIKFTNPGDLYVYDPIAKLDLTGMRVEVDQTTSSCKRFAAFSGNSSVSIGCTGSRDPLFQQLYPTTSWGKTYAVTQPLNRKYNLRILAAEDNTTVLVNGAKAAVLNKGEKIELNNYTSDLFITADKIISVAQYMLTQSCASLLPGIYGDPDMVILNPIEFSVKNITVFSADKQAITQRYLNVVMKTDQTSSFKINGQSPGGTWIPFENKPEYAYNQISVFNASLTLTANDGFNAIAFGFGQFESYAYSAGTSLASNQYITVVNKQTRVGSSNACVYQASDLEVTLPYYLKKIVWKYDDGTPDYTDANPNPRQTITQTGQVLYTYYSPANKSFNTVGERNLKAIGTFDNAANPCFGTEGEFTFTFNVEPLPTASFSVSATNCPDAPVAFNDSSTSNVTDRSISKWLWDFGDGNTEIKNNNSTTTHTYTSKGTYLAKLIVYTETGCASDVFSNTVTINEKITPAFDLVGTSCVNQPTIFKDKSTIDAGGSLTKWIWDMGDGSAPITTDTPDQTYVYQSAGDFIVKLTVLSDKGCSSAVVAKTITIAPLPIVEFEIPDFCLADGVARFTNRSQSADATTLTYLWNFGDANANSSRPNTSTTTDGTHAYNAVGIYRVTLTATTIKGCSVSVSKTFTVNGAVDAANFKIINDGTCSGNDVIITDQSIVSFGEVSKVDIYPDLIKDPTRKMTVMEPAGKEIKLSYPFFGGAADRIYQIRYVAYSGQSCSKETTKTVTIHPTPVLTFDQLPSFCYNDHVATLTQAAETSGAVGIGRYSGAGIEDGFIFDPKLAGEGDHVITYTFTTDKGCKTIITQTLTVNKSPIITTEKEYTIFAGGNKQLMAFVNAGSNSVSYNWSPATGLDRTDVANPMASPSKDTEYTLIVTTNLGCTAVAKIYVKVLEDIKPPNTFTPNGDNVNDVWNIPYLDTYPNAEVEVYNRNGEQVFKSKGYAKPFDGNRNNQQLPVGTYVYIIYPNSGRKPVTGMLTLIR